MYSNIPYFSITRNKGLSCLFRQTKRMIRKALYIILLTAIHVQIGFGQDDSILIDFRFVFDEQEVKEAGLYKASNNNYQLEKCRLYLSNFQLLDDEQNHLERIETAWLLDLNNPDSWRVTLPKVEGATFVKFGIGIDSVINTSGAFGGDLDPTNGMYWSWQSGYINVKLEGKIIAPKPQKFEYHLGGYASPFSAYQVSDVFPLNEVTEISINLLLFLEGAQKLDFYKTMSPSEQSVKLSALFAPCFQLNEQP